MYAVSNYCCCVLARIVFLNSMWHWMPLSSDSVIGNISPFCLTLIPKLLEIALVFLPTPMIHLHWDQGFFYAGQPSKSLNIFHKKRSCCTWYPAISTVILKNKSRCRLHFPMTRYRHFQVLSNEVFFTFRCMLWLKLFLRITNTFNKYKV